jgi:hypothetical protein
VIDAQRVADLKVGGRGRAIHLVGDRRDEAKMKYVENRGIN